jgi:predicted peroxiredoxin
VGTYLLVETRDPFDSVDADHFCELATGLADEHHDVVFFLTQNAVLGTRRGASKAPKLGQLATKATVLADDFSLRERAISTDDLVDGIYVAGVDRLVDLAVSGRKVIWH